MIITCHSITPKSKEDQGMTRQVGDVICIEKFNSLSSPVTASMYGGGEYWIETLDVQTGLMRLDVCGQIDLSSFGLVKSLIDADGISHDPDDFWVEQYKCFVL